MEEAYEEEKKIFNIEREWKLTKKKSMTVEVPSIT